MSKKQANLYVRQDTINRIYQLADELTDPILRLRPSDGQVIALATNLFQKHVAVAATLQLPDTEVSYSDKRYRLDTTTIEKIDALKETLSLSGRGAIVDRAIYFFNKQHEAQQARKGTATASAH
ncbi:hypothetical protein [Fibrella aestuarina]|nr:hypothetical protein [Fibrella aestuarina]